MGTDGLAMIRESWKKVCGRSGLADRAGVFVRRVKTNTIQHISKYDGMSEDKEVEALANGANDVVVVRKSTGELEATGWYGQIGKLNSVFESRQGKEVAIFVGSVPARPKMIVRDSGSFQFKAGPPHFMSSEDLEELNLKLGLNPARGGQVSPH